jgi:hypothetical protein
VLAGIDYEIDKIAEAVGQAEPRPIDRARLAALNDASRERQGLPLPSRLELEPTVSELSAEYVRWWKAQDGLKQSNTEAQKKATFQLFSGFWGDRSIRDVRQADAAKFFDALRLLDPLYARSP